MRVIKVPVWTFLAMTLFSSAPTFAMMIGVEFVQGAVALSTSQVAGVVPQGYFNHVSVASGAGTSGTTSPLAMSDGSISAVTFTHSSGDGYVSQTDTTTANGILLYGEDKTGPVGGGGPTGFTATYTFNNAPSGVYDLIAYTEDQKSNTFADITVGATRNYITEQASNGTPAFLLANNTAPSNRVVGNYVEFFDVAPVGGVIILTNTNEGSNSSAIDGFQLISVVPEPGFLVVPALAGLMLLRRRPQRIFV